MNKKEISERIFKKLDIKRFEAYYFIDLFIEVMVENLSQNKKVVISNFGTFKVVEREDKRVINPNDKKAIEDALQLREEHGGEVIILSMGPS